MGNVRFKVGQRVRPSQYGIDKFIFPKTRHQQTGIVTKVDEYGDPTVLWEGRKRHISYHPAFITHDRRRKATP